MVDKEGSMGAVSEWGAGKGAGVTSWGLGGGSSNPWNVSTDFLGGEVVVCCFIKGRSGEERKGRRMSPSRKYQCF